MKSLLILVLTGGLAGFGLCACSTAERAGDDAAHVVNKTGHAAGHVLEKTGSAVAHGGEKLESHTVDQ